MPNEKFGCFSQVWNAGAKALVASNPVSDEGTFYIRCNSGCLTAGKRRDI